ncbi:hypothetical protein RJT34_25539 [Clitoria ternatea]|uniref:Uncharacterized protein n=1 Tax=Clitoria ternatea TaxID=43366 RepID=A0AAN9FQ52_CLITE
MVQSEEDSIDDEDLGSFIENEEDHQNKSLGEEESDFSLEAETMERMVELSKSQCEPNPWNDGQNGNTGVKNSNGSINPSSTDCGNQKCASPRGATSTTHAQSNKRSDFIANTGECGSFAQETISVMGSEKIEKQKEKDVGNIGLVVSVAQFEELSPIGVIKEPIKSASPLPLATHGDQRHTNSGSPPPVEAQDRICWAEHTIPSEPDREGLQRNTINSIEGELVHERKILEMGSKDDNNKDPVEPPLAELNAKRGRNKAEYHRNNGKRSTKTRFSVKSKGRKFKNSHRCDSQV